MFLWSRRKWVKGDSRAVLAWEEANHIPTLAANAIGRSLFRSSVHRVVRLAVPSRPLVLAAYCSLFRAGYREKAGKPRRDVSDDEPVPARTPPIFALTLVRSPCPRPAEVYILIS
jgi:hypothetical protein